MSIYLKGDTPEKEINAIKSRIAKLDNVIGVKYVSAEEARDQQAKQYEDDPEALEAIKESSNEMSATLRVSVEDLNNQKSLENFIKTDKLYKKYKDRKHFSGKTIIMKYGQKVEDRYIGPAEIMSDEQANSLVTSKYKNTETSRDLTRKYYDEVKDMDDTSKRLYLDMKLWIVEDILLKADKMTMANSIELRVPLLDKKMWELAKTIPVKYKVHDEITKYAFRKAAKNKLPEDWAKRRKLGFVVPFVVWIREEKYYKIVKEIFNKDFVSEFFDKEKINSLLDDHFNNIANNGRKIYTIYTFLKWYEIYFATQTA